jgi:hypothetical protein
MLFVLKALKLLNLTGSELKGLASKLLIWILMVFLELFPA